MNEKRPSHQVHPGVRAGLVMSHGCVMSHEFVMNRPRPAPQPMLPLAVFRTFSICFHSWAQCQGQQPNPLGSKTEISHDTCVRRSDVGTLRVEG